VFCDPTVRALDDVLSPDITLQAWSARDAGGLKLQQHFRDGSFAEQNDGGPPRGTGGCV
jgi:hypothetical protein